MAGLPGGRAASTAGAGGPSSEADLAAKLMARRELFVDDVLKEIRARASYRTVDDDELRAAVTRHVDGVLAHFAEAEFQLTSADLAFFHHMGATRAREGVSIRDLVAVWRRLTERLQEEAYRLVAHVPNRGELLLRTVEITNQLDRGMLAMVSGYEDAEIETDTAGLIRTGNTLMVLFSPETTSEHWETTLGSSGLDPASTYRVFRCRPTGDEPLARTVRYLRHHQRTCGVLRFGLADDDVVGIADAEVLDPPVPVGVSAAVPPARFPAAFRTATRALRAALALGCPAASTMDDLGLIPAVLDDHDVGEAMHRRFIRPVLRGCADPESVLRTVMTFLDCHRSVSDTASRMHLHTNTVRYRVARFEDLTDSSLRNTGQLVQVWWALQHYRHRGVMSVADER
ncbi:helix-turn-helix domain-containing protein [Georgenia sp. AZ-5]|uniref:helix-turn-helix domain-containing protein n=1 Tax=Georgenia sp. AZ-5 TaxID=3367526 RepID=UPI00375449AC